MQNSLESPCLQTFHFKKGTFFHLFIAQQLFPKSIFLPEIKELSSLRSEIQNSISKTMALASLFSEETAGIHLSVIPSWEWRFHSFIHIFIYHLFY